MPGGGLFGPVALPEVARAFERKLGVEGPALDAAGGAPLPRAHPLDQGEEPGREERGGEQGREAAPAAPDREIDQDRQAEQREERARRQGRAEQETRSGEEREVAPTSPSIAAGAARRAAGRRRRP